VIAVSLHGDCRLPAEIIHANLLAIPGAPKDHELSGKFGSIWVLEEVNPPPPMPCTILEHTIRIDFPYIIEDLVHAAFQMK
jgi:hypothetical protein